MSPELPKLMPLKDWAAARFAAGKAPSERTLLQMCREGRIPAKQFGGKGEWWVEVEAELKQTGNPLVDKVLAHG